MIDKDILGITSQPLGLMNKILLVCASKKILFLLNKFFKFFLHVTLPKDSYEKKIRLAHPYCVEINPNAILEYNLTIYHNVTIGSQRFGHRKGVPTIGENTIIYPNTVISGNIKIGKNCIIGSGSIVTKDIEDYSIVGGNPAKVIGKIES